MDVLPRTTQPERPECWICRDVNSKEPLVQPCRCRGSMAGVHASCVEAWVQSRLTLQEEPPHCPVCRTLYGGNERRPGPRTLARHMAKGLARQLALTVGEVVRFVFLGVLLIQYKEASTGASARPRDGSRGDSPTCSSGGGTGLAMGALAVWLLHKLLVLMASLPVPRAPPGGAWLRRFFTADTWILARHVAELLAAVVLLGARCACGELPLAYFAPVAAVALSPVANLLLWYPVSACLKEALMLTAFLACAPLLALSEMVRLAWHHRRRLANPLDGALHVVISLVAVLLGLVFQSRQPVATLFALHSLLLILLLCAMAACRRLPWRPGPAWWSASLIAAEAFSLSVERRWITLLLLLAALRSLRRAAARPGPYAPFQGPLWWCTLLVMAEAASLALREMRGPAVAEAVMPLAGIWLALLCCLACVVNRRLCTQHYHRWQRRHATFVLCATTAATVAGAPRQEVDVEEDVV